MGKRNIFTCIIFFIWLFNLNAQQSVPFSVRFIHKKPEVTPGQIINLPFFVKNNLDKTENTTCTITAPADWKGIAGMHGTSLNSGEEKLLLFSIQPPATTAVGNYQLKLFVVHNDSGDTLASHDFSVQVTELENISMLLIQSPEFVYAGDTIKTKYLIQNLGNTSKKIFIETLNCDVVGPPEFEVEAGKSIQFDVQAETSADLIDTKREYYTVRAILSGEVKKSIYRSVTVFPSKKGVKDLYFRFPVTAKITYVASNYGEQLQKGYQFQIAGEGPVDPQGKHQLQFMARGPNLSRLSYLGLYDQYFISYSNKNAELFVGEKAFSFTPLTESSRYGFGTENKIMLNNGLNFGIIYVKPTFFEGIQYEMAGYTGFDFKNNNEIKFAYIQKNTIESDPIRLASVSGIFTPLKKTNIEIELSQGYLEEKQDNAMRTSFNSQIWNLNLAGTYFYTGKNYPGYYTNSTFYSGNISARITKKLNIGLFVKEDFQNAKLDTFFLTAPYTKSFQSSANYKVAQKAHLNIYWRTFERKDRLINDKFHYITKSINTRFNQRFKKTDYTLFGEFGETKNLMLTGNNQQTTYRGMVDIGYSINSKNSIRLTGGWSNINSFVSEDNRNFTAGLFMMSQISKNVRADLHIQNAYDIDDYYRNRNLMQFNFEYKFLKHHAISARSFYTLFKQQTENPKFTATLNYSYHFGVPLKQIIKAGNLKGRISYDNDEPAEGVIVTLQNKTAITNHNGEFSVNTIQPGRHLLYIDRSKFKIDQLTSIPSPVQIEILEDRESVVNIRITDGARLTGEFVMVDEKNSVLLNPKTKPESIVIELKSNFDEFRITSNSEGEFSFPLVRPGNYFVRIFQNSVPAGYELETPEYEIYLNPGENKKMQIKLNAKKRNIVFKPSVPLNTLTNRGTTNDAEIKLPAAKQVTGSQDFYSVQVGAFKRKQTSKSKFFSKLSFDFEIQENNLYKYYVGKFVTEKEAKTKKEELGKIFKNPFVVKIKSNTMQNINGLNQ